MRTETIEIFTFNELSGAAKERARYWYRSSYEFEPDYIIDDVEAVAKILGIEFDVKSRNRPEPKIWWSGFYSQGDGACFEGRYSYAHGSCKAIREYAPNDKTLHSIADALRVAQRPYFYGLSAVCEHSGRYYHSGCMQVRVDGCDMSERNVDADEIVGALRSFADWIYSQLEAAYTAETDDEGVDENILANGYEFDVYGNAT